MYDVTGVLPTGTVSELKPGTSLLIAGPAMSGKQDLALDLLAAGLEGENGLLIVTTNETAAACIDELEHRVATLDRDQVGVVDCSGGSQQQAIRDIATQRVSSPDDLTGISIGTAKLMQQFATQEISSVRHGLVSVSTLLQYLDLTTVFKFLHIYTTRITDTQGLGIFTVDNVSHDPQTINTVVSEFDGVIELRESETGEREIRLRGIADASKGWQSL
jgi:KaiC/GvpD/RAD55 family RecA-like ATPase